MPSRVRFVSQSHVMHIFNNRKSAVRSTFVHAT